MNDNSSLSLPSALSGVGNILENVFLTHNKKMEDMLRSLLQKLEDKIDRIADAVIVEQSRSSVTPSISAVNNNNNNNNNNNPPPPPPPPVTPSIPAVAALMVALASSNSSSSSQPSRSSRSLRSSSQSRSQTSSSSSSRSSSQSCVNGTCSISIDVDGDDENESFIYCELHDPSRQLSSTKSTKRRRPSKSNSESKSTKRIRKSNESSRKRKRPTRQRPSLDTPCVKCGGDRSVAPNLIVYCDGCDKGYHQNCHIPSIRPVPRGRFFCKTCSRRRHDSDNDDDSDDGDSDNDDDSDDGDSDNDDDSDDDDNSKSDGDTNSKSSSSSTSRAVRRSQTPC